MKSLVRVMAVALLGLGTATAALAQEEVRGIAPRQQGLRVIEEKCLACHNRKRIDAAVRERRDMERIISEMEKKGVKLTEKDRAVMGHFWKQSPFKEKKGAAPPAPHGQPPVSR